MINIGQLTPRQVGEYVYYTPTDLQALLADRSLSDSERAELVASRERGRLKSYNDTTIYVVFNCGDQWDNYQNYTGQGCDPTDLTFIDPAARRDNCIEHYYMPYGQYANGRKCISCGDEIGTKW